MKLDKSSQQLIIGGVVLVVLYYFYKSKQLQKTATEQVMEPQKSYVNDTSAGGAWWLS